MPRTATAALACLAAVILGGCAPSADDRSEPPPSSETPTPVGFASDEDALAAAEAAYRRYWEVSGQVGADPEVSLDRLNEVAEGEFLDGEREFHRSARLRGERDLGEVLVSNVVLQSRSFATDAQRVTLYACVDISSTRVLDDQGADVTPVDRPLKLPFEATLNGAVAGLRVSENRVTRDTSICD